MTIRFGKKTVEESAPPPPATPAPSASPPSPKKQDAKDVFLAGPKATAQNPTDVIRDQVLQRIEPATAVRMNKAELTEFVDSLVMTIASERKLLMNQDEQDALAVNIVDEMIGLGPIEPLLNDPSVSDI
ncbi:MAG: CpaF family protein, partial [Alphaproteobacteria bacterium]